MNQSRTQILASIALLTALVAPQAYAQDAAAAAPTAEASASAPTPADAAAPSTGAPAATASASGKKTWAELDANKDGNLSKTEATPMAALAAVFDKADTNADGSLTGAEYKAYVAAASGNATQGAAGSKKNK